MHFKFVTESTTRFFERTRFTVLTEEALSGSRQYLKVISWIPSAHYGWLAKYGKRVFFGFCGSLWFLGNSP